MNKAVQRQRGRSGTALVAVLILGALLSGILLAATRRSAALREELNLLDKQQKARLEKAVSGPDRYTAEPAKAAEPR